MQFLILSDLHANWPALEAVLADAAGEYTRIACCGDIVGYNPYPAQVLEWSRKHCESAVRGNHDKVVAGVDGMEDFNDAARIAAEWTRAVLEEPELGYLKRLPKGPALHGDFEICHGSPLDEDEYITTTEEAAPQFPMFQTSLMFFGHTHLQGGFFYRYGNVGGIRKVPLKRSESIVELQPGTVYFINPGAVGQPRDRDPRAAYALYDSESRIVCLRRVQYDIGAAVQAIRRAGLPSMLGLRLFSGF